MKFDDQQQLDPLYKKIWAIDPDRPKNVKNFFILLYVLLNLWS